MQSEAFSEKWHRRNKRRTQHQETARQPKGSFAAELPAGLWLLFMLVMLPLIDLGTVALRYTFVLTASREAALAASRSKTFYTDLSTGEPSARNAATAAATNAATHFSGITINSVSTRLIATNVTTDQSIAYTTVLTSPADTTDNLYFYEATVNAQIQPLVKYNGPLLKNIPGLSAPVTVSVSSQKVCENTQGLTQ